MVEYMSCGEFLLFSLIKCLIFRGLKGINFHILHKFVTSELPVSH